MGRVSNHLSVINIEHEYRMGLYYYDSTNETVKQNVTSVAIITIYNQVS